MRFEFRVWSRSAIALALTGTAAFGLQKRTTRVELVMAR